MAQPRIRDFLTYLTTLPAGVMIAVCLFLPHTKGCHGRVHVPIEDGTWLVVLPLVVIGALPVAWRALPGVRERLPEIMLAFTMIALALVVITIPIAIWLMYGYAKRAFRGELLVAMCSAVLVMIWLFFYPVITLFETWLPAADMTWGAACVELFGVLVWTSAATARPHNADEQRSLQVPLHFVLDV